MKILNVILFKDDENDEMIFEKLSRNNLLPHQEFCGRWGEMSQFNKDECLRAVSGAVNYFLKLEDKTEIYFGCSEKDYNDIISLIDRSDCKVNILYCSDFEH